MCESPSTDPFAGRGAFRNEAYTDFGDPHEAQVFQEALDQVRSRMGERYPLIIAGRAVWTEETFASVNPAHPDQVIGFFSQANEDLANEAVDAAVEAFQSWKRTPADERAGILFRAADIIRARRHEFSAWLVYEIGKPWAEADAETAELIDYLEYYGRQMLRLTREPQPYQVMGECDEVRHIPLGAGVVISPWNFPLAIMGGMSSAAIVTGNTIVLKPASTAPQVAWEFIQVLLEAGLPEDVVSFITGPGGRIGDALVDHPQTRFVAFTGSKEVGIHIYERAARVQPGQHWLKRAILEMGGKGAVVVDETADLESAAQGIVASAMGYSGQKCSAGSRAIVVEEVYDRVLDLVQQEVRERVRVGDPARADTFMGPLIDAGQYNKVRSYIDIGRREGRLVLSGQSPEEEGYYVGPTVFADVEPHARIAQEEIFGPVLTVIRAQDYRDAVRIANDTEYGLTSSFYSRDPERIDWAKDELHVGNLYINRKSTGAFIGAHPFGGFNMSGTDSKAGGPDYLLWFTQAKAIGEKVEEADREVRTTLKTVEAVPVYR
jgi:1-pyrroline-5-carboxylate dehydrogenase